MDQEENKSDQADLRSRNSTTRVRVRFLNLTGRTVKIVWIDFSGQYVEYRDMEPRHALDLTTFKTHPWIVFDVNTYDRMHIDKSFVYLPKAWQEYNLSGRFINNPPDREPRLLIPITLPLNSLKLLSLRKVRDCIGKEEMVDLLEVPYHLKNAVRNLIKLKNGFLQPDRFINHRPNV